MVDASSSTPASSAPASGVPTPGTSTPASVTDASSNGGDPLPTFSSLDLSLSRDQGTHHVSGYGAGSEAHALSDVAVSNHGVLSRDILSRTGGSAVAAGNAALSPLNLPQAPSELPSTPEPGTLTSVDPMSTAASSVGPSSNVATPGDGQSRVGTPALAASSSPGPVAASAAAAAATSSKPASPSPAAAMAPPPVKPPLKEKKSVFGKLFERNNASSQSIASSHGGGGGSGGAASGGEKMERGGSHDTSSTGAPASAAAGGGGGATPASLGGAPIVRKPSTKKEEKKERKEQERREKEEEKERRQQMRARAPSEDRSALSSGHADVNGAARPRSGSHGATGGGMGQALNDFMRHKVQRKSSQTSRKSDEGRSDHDGDDSRSRGGQSATSLSKKYGVCEKVVIGKGATAVVKLAHKWDRSTERLYAVKEFRKRRKNETEKEYVKKLTSEFCISSTLHHHNIVETVDLVQDEQNHWCEVMEYCPGGDLYAAIKKGDMGAPEINSYFKQILAGVAYLHSMGVAHRDIKPENLLLDAKGHVKITDFGVSDVFRMCWEKTTHLSKGLCGSEPYIAPEQFDHKEYDARLVDVWACAIVFYCMHFQELPWRVAKISDPSFGPYVHAYHETSSPPPLSNLVPRECRNIIKKMLDPDPKTRVTTEQIIADPWFNQIKVIPELENILPPRPSPGLPLP